MGGRDEEPNTRADSSSRGAEQATDHSEGRPGISLSPEMVLATNVVVFLSRKGGQAATLEELGSALGVRADDPLLSEVLDRLSQSGIVRRSPDGPATVYFNGAAGKLSLAHVATAVGERLVCAGGGRAQGDGLDEALSHIWHEIHAGLEALDVSSLSRGGPAP